jgi:hypothetical protein
MKATCPICNNNNCVELLPLVKQPLSRYGLSITKDASSKVHKYPIHIFICKFCEFIFNNDFDPNNVDYRSNEVQESSIFSEGIKQYMDDSVLFLKSMLDLSGESILEIGCGEGYFINSFRDSELIAYEPSPEGYMAEDLGVRVFHEYLSLDNIDKYTYKKPHLIAMRQVLEHIQDPLSFLKILKNFAKESSSSYLYIEVPNSYLSVNDSRFYDFYYEHVNYFTIASISNLMNKAGYRVISCSEEYSGEIIRVLAELPKKGRNPSLPLESRIEKTAKYIIDKSKKGNIIVGWGASGNGPSFLNYNNLDCNIVSYIIDSDIRKQGKYIPVTGQKVYSPMHLTVDKPDVVIIFSQFHKKDIESEINDIFGNGNPIEIIVL